MPRRRFHFSFGLFLGLLALSRAGEGVNPRFTGTPFLRTWTQEDYGGSAVVAAIVQHPVTGFIYAASGARVLEFDGVRWRGLGATDRGTINSLAIDARGRVWFAAVDGVGCFESDARGELRAVSAQPRLPADDPGLAGLAAALATPDGVYFANRHRVVCLPNAGGPAQVWRFDDDELAVRLWLQDDAVHVRGTRDALRLREGKFLPVPGLRTAALLARRHPERGWQLVGNDGVRLWDGAYRSSAADIAAAANAFQGQLALCAAFLGDRRIAFGTGRGVLICDESGRFEQLIDRTRGLPANRVEAVCADREGGLWVALRNGIARLQLDSPLARHGIGQERIDSSPGALGLHRGELFVGGGEGLWRRGRDGAFHAIAEVPFLVRSLVSLDDKLFATGIELRRVEADRTIRLGTAYYGLVPVSTALGVIARGSNNGLVIERTGGETWTRLGQPEKISGVTSAICEWPAGVIWAANAGGVWRVDLRAGWRRDAPVRNYTRADGLPAGVTANNVELYPWSSALGGSLAGRLVRFDPAADRFVAETRIAGLTPDPDGFVVAAPLGARPEADGALWLQLRSLAASLVHVVPDGSDHWRVEPPLQPALTRLRALALLPETENHTLWIATTGMLVSRDLAWRATEPPAPVRAAIRRVETLDGNLIWADGQTFSGTSPTPPPRLVLEPNQNAVRVLFTTPSFAGDYLGRVHIQFRTRLEGIDADWSTWRGQSTRDFTNLPYRDFVFQVEARDEEGRVSPVATLAFAVTPPWWWTPWAKSAYALLGVLAVLGLVQWRTRALQRRAQSLEAVVATRTDELRRSNAELARLHALERDEKLAARLGEEKARLEVLRYQLNPHFLFNALNSVCAQINQAPGAARGMVVRLADFCRQTLRPGPEESVMTVGQELTMLRSYLEIEKARLGELLTTEVEADPAVADVRLPPFLILPLVENAVKYGTATSEERVGIRLRVSGDGNGGLVIEVANTGKWLEPGAHSTPSTGIGLENLRQRLARYYPEAHEFATSAADGWVHVRVRLSRPMRLEAEDGEQRAEDRGRRH